MTNEAHDHMRRVLAQHPDGLPLSELASKTGANSYDRAMRQLDTMADAVIDRWIKRGDGYEPVVMLAEITADCPRPDGKPLNAARQMLRRHSGA